MHKNSITIVKLQNYRNFSLKYISKLKININILKTHLN